MDQRLLDRRAQLVADARRSSAGQRQGNNVRIADAIDGHNYRAPTLFLQDFTLRTNASPLASLREVDATQRAGSGLQFLGVRQCR
jgi:hypothetical protein